MTGRNPPTQSVDPGLEVQLEPQVGGKAPDFAVRHDGARVYFEVIGPSVVARDGASALVRISRIADHVDGIDLGEHPAVGAVRFAMAADRGLMRSVDAKVAVPDDRVQRLFTAELHHFSPGHPNVLVIDVSSVPGGPKQWPALIRRRFQPSQNTRVGAVMLCSVHFDGVVAPGLLDGDVLRNQHATMPIPENLVTAIVSGFA